MTPSLNRQVFLFLITLVASLGLACSSNTDPDPMDKTFSITGTISPSGGEDVSGVTVSVGTASATTSATGAYTISGLEGGSYTVTPSKADHSFTPASLSVTISDANVSGQDFVIAGVSSQPLRPDMVEIQPGTFTMGGAMGAPGGSNISRPRHQVTITKGFYIAQTEVTQEQYEAVTGENPSSFPVEGSAVTNVLYHEAIEYCNKLSDMEGLQRAYSVNGTAVVWNQSANGYRLPTEAEWEYAARAGDTNNTYNGHNQGGDPNPVIDPIAWYYYNSSPPPHLDVNTARPSPVAQKRANAWNLYDVLGSVREMVYDGPYDYTSDPAVDPFNPNDGVKYICRGGSYSDIASSLTLSTRELGPTTSRWNPVGFRIAKNK